MTPKEKAIQLVDRFFNAESQKLSDYSRIYHPTAKQCALISISETLEELSNYCGIEELESAKEFYNEVVNEINNL